MVLAYPTTADQILNLFDILKIISKNGSSLTNVNQLTVPGLVLAANKIPELLK
jgi:hypothetical protein